MNYKDPDELEHGTTANSSAGTDFMPILYGEISCSA